jgi:hypothetical protein
MGLYMLKKYSGTRNENACASIAEKGKKRGGRGENKVAQSREEHASNEASDLTDAPQKLT